MDKTKLKDFANKIREDVLYTEKGHFESARLWRMYNYVLMLVSIITVIISLLFTFSDCDKFILGLIASTSAFVTILLIFLNPQEKYLSHYNSATRFLGLRNKIDFFLDIQMNNTDDLELLEKRLNKLVKKKNNINKASLPISRDGYEKAKNLIEKEKTAQYEVEKRRENESK